MEKRIRNLQRNSKIVNYVIIGIIILSLSSIIFTYYDFAELKDSKKAIERLEKKDAILKEREAIAQLEKDSIYRELLMLKMDYALQKNKYYQLEVLTHKIEGDLHKTIKNLNKKQDEATHIPNVSHDKQLNALSSAKFEKYKPVKINK